MSTQLLIGVDKCPENDQLLSVKHYCPTCRWLGASTAKCFSGCRHPTSAITAKKQNQKWEYVVSDVGQIEFRNVKTRGRWRSEYEAPFVTNNNRKSVRFIARWPIIAMRTIIESGRDPELFRGLIIN